MILLLILFSSTYITTKSTYIEGEKLDIVGWMMMSPKYYNTFGFKTPKVNLVDIQKSCETAKTNDFIYYKSPIDFENVTDDNSEHIDVDFIKYLTYLIYGTLTLSYM